ncbi:MAG TPA: DoxX family protein [Solirubrobacteraceae bacterium]|nr:DoxX family protein [Solirubrobacteraceae bacterium]
MNTVIWIVQGILAAVFLAAGLMKLTQPREALKEKTPYVEDLTDGQVKAIGTVEVLGAIGIVLPAALKVAPILTPIAACGLALTMVVAAVTLIRRGETSHVPLNVFIFALAVFVAIERFGPYAL